MSLGVRFPIIVVLVLVCICEVWPGTANPVVIAGLRSDGKSSDNRLYYRNSSNLNLTYSLPFGGLQAYSPMVSTYAPRSGYLLIVAYDGLTSATLCPGHCTGNETAPRVRYDGSWLVAAASGAVSTLEEAFYLFTRSYPNGELDAIRLFKIRPSTSYAYQLSEIIAPSGWLFCDTCSITFDSAHNFLWFVAQPTNNPEPRANQRLAFVDLNWLTVTVPFPGYKVLGSAGTYQFLYSDAAVAPHWIFVSDGANIQSVDIVSGKPNSPLELFPPCKAVRKVAGVVDWRPVNFGGMICGTLWSVDSCRAERPNSMRAALLCDSGVVIPSGPPIPVEDGFFPLAVY